MNLHSLSVLDRRRKENGKIFYFSNSLSGAPEELLNDAAVLPWAATYTSWGNLEIEETEQVAVDHPGAVSIEQNLGYQGQYLDREIGLNYNTFRFYDSDIGAIYHT